jgi:hypothetical protein
MPTAAQLAARVEAVQRDLNILQGKIEESYNSLVKGASSELGGLDLKLKNEIKELAQKESEYNVLFQEEEARRQAMGGKSRKQTLQEFVLLFFFVSLAVFALSMALYSASTGGLLSAVKILGLSLIIALIVSAIIIKYA